VPIYIDRVGDGYRGRARPPEVDEEWFSDGWFPRDELRWKIESMGANPIDIADAFHAADVRRDATREAFRQHGVTDEIAVALAADEAVFVLSEAAAAHLRNPGLDAELQRLLGRKTWVVTSGSTRWPDAVPL
jgi:hypothetical protein